MTLVRLLVVVTSLSVATACAKAPERKISELSTAELDAAHIIHGEARAEFEAHVSNRKAFILVGTCDPETRVAALRFEDASGRSTRVALSEGKTALLPVIPGQYAITEVESEPGESVPVSSGSLSVATAKAITFLGGVDEERASRIVACPSLAERAARLYPYQMAKLPFFYGNGVEKEIAR